MSGPFISADFQAEEALFVSQLNLETLTRPQHRGSRRRTGRPAPPDGGAERRRRRTGQLLAAGQAAVVAGLGALGAVASYGPLSRVAAGGSPSTATGWWPLLVLGPGTVACLCILRAVLHRRRAALSWMVALFFSGLAMSLCMYQAPRTIPALIVAGLPPVSVLIAFWQLVRQLTLVAPRHAVPPEYARRRV
jgi:hypothetical protein